MAPFEQSESKGAWHLLSGSGFVKGVYGDPDVFCCGLCAAGSYNVITYTYGGAPGLDTTQMFSATNQVPGTFGGNLSAPNRWADPDNSSGVSGPPNMTATNAKNIINNNNNPKGGPADCPWNVNNCGPNDEPFSLHTGGCQAVLADGSVRFLSENLDRQIIRRICNPGDGEVVGEF